ncbi:macrolide ABC transporter ATP-binding protein [Vulcanimicrobium alpinum]|uniref:Macrolide ABC transporter ATP-binding protein n=1 Tax=Vulcanimicrobium alpinum TaxID=3016050 RepID=A0AAN1XY07_UNVUL|nr:ABC transporter ATP-binding protein [Vulcanimicrobium alpinum]BDE07029.1 macrolide ABC transporter ATP-binding protein [Vulcanimicrobium alpinum]
MTAEGARAAASAVLPVAVRDVTKTYGSGDEEVHALTGVSLDVRRGEMVALVGPSGCGKSTLLNVIGCVDLPTGGTVAIDGTATGALDDDALTRLRRDRVGTVFQFFNLLPALRVADNVALPLVLQRVPRGEIDGRVAAALASVGLAEKARAFPAQLSGGQMQRVAIARAIVHRPAVLLADEPTGNLDSHTGALVLRLLRGLADSGQAIVMATHSDDAAAMCDRVVHMRDGAMVPAGR